MKILFINNFFNPGGSTAACYELARNLKDCEMQFVGCYGTSYIEKFQKLGTCHCLTQQPKFNYDHDEIQSIILKFNPDIIHIFIPGHEYPEYFKSLPEKCVKIVTVLCGQQIGFDSNVFDAVIFLSRYNAEMSKLLVRPEKQHIVRCGLGTIEDKFSKKDRVQISFGRISAFCPSKRIMETIECAKICPDNPFYIAGEIQDENYYRAIALEASQLDNVFLYHNVDDRLKENIYSSIDVLHYPTSNEAFCFSVLEGMQRSKTVLTYNNSALPELNVGLIVPDNSIEMMKELTREIASNRKLVDIIGKLNRKTYEEFYTSDRYSMEIKSLYISCLGRKRSVDKKSSVEFAKSN